MIREPREAEYGCQGRPTAVIKPDYVAAEPLEAAYERKLGSRTETL